MDDTSMLFYTAYCPSEHDIDASQHIWPIAKSQLNTSLIEESEIPDFESFNQSQISQTFKKNS